MSTRTSLLLLAIMAWSLACASSSAGEPVSPPIETMPYLGPLDGPPFPPPPQPGGSVSSGGLVGTAGGAPVTSSYVEPRGNYCSQAYEWQMMPQGLIYRSYLAGAKESRFRSLWNNEADQGNIWDISLGGNVGLLRYGTTGDVRPEGWQLGIEGAGLTRLDLDEERDVDATDYRFGIPMTWGDSIYQVKFAFYHLSSHLGDEFLLKHPTFDRLNYSRNVLVLGGSLYPSENLRVYGEVGFAFEFDVCKPWELQSGIDWCPNGATGTRGAPFAAVNGHLRQEVDFGGNFVAQTGWCWRRSPASGLFRTGVEYYNGKEDQFSFFNQSVRKVGFGIWYDY